MVRGGGYIRAVTEKEKKKKKKEWRNGKSRERESWRCLYVSHISLPLSVSKEPQAGAIRKWLATFSADPEWSDCSVVRSVVVFAVFVMSRQQRCHC